MLKDWYNKHIAARWYASVSMWVGIAAGMVEFLPEWLEMLNDNWPVAADALFLDESQRRTVQAVLLFVIMPIARAWRQKSITQATLKQANVRNLKDDAAPTMVDKPAQ